MAWTIYSSVCSSSISLFMIFPPIILVRKLSLVFVLVRKILLVLSFWSWYLHLSYHSGRDIFTCPIILVVIFSLVPSFWSWYDSFTWPIILVVKIPLDHPLSYNHSSNENSTNPIVLGMKILPVLSSWKTVLNLEWLVIC